MNIRDKIVDYLSRRDHSEKELIQKLKLKKYSPEEIRTAIIWAKEHGLLKKPEFIAESMGRMLHNKKKGILYINQYLKNKGLPTIETDFEIEKAKAEKLVLKQFGPPPYTYDLKQKIYGYLARRGFQGNVLKEVFKLQEDMDY